MTKNLIEEDDDLTEILFMKTDRVDLVGGAANGTDFLLAKSTSDPSLFSPEFVSELAKSAQEGDMTAKKTAPTEELVKADLDPEELLETPEVEADGDPSDPGSPAWEAVDAARAVQAIELTVGLKRLVEQAIAREGQEALIGDDPDDAENVWCLSDVVEMIDCILGVLAPFAVTEQAEADGREADDSLILKSGRVLSGTNEDNIRKAVGMLESVLSSLPAPIEEPIMKSEIEEDKLAKAGDPQLLVYGPTGAAGGPLGSIDPEKLTTFAPAPEADDAAEPDAEPAATPDAPLTPDAAAAEAAAPETPADPADGEVIPGTDTVQTPAEDAETVKKGQFTTEVHAALEEVLQPLVKQLSETAGLSELVKSLQERVDSFGRKPDDRISPRLNGASGFVERAQESDGLADLRKAVDEATTPDARKVASVQLLSASIKERFTN
jgi:hypothetical protein